MKCPVIFGAVLIAVQAHAQEPFFQAYTGYPVSPDIVELASGNLFTGLSTDEPLEWCTSLLDSDGIVMHTQCYALGSAPGNMSFGFHLKRRNDNEMCFATRVVSTDTCSIINGVLHRKEMPAIGRMDSLGAILSLNAYDMGISTCYSYPMGLEVLSDNSTIIFGGNNGAFAIKADPSGQVAWAKHFADADRIVFLTELPNGDLVTGFNFDTGGASVARMAPDGSIIWMRSFFRPRGWLADALVLADGTMVVCGVTDRYVSGIPWPPAEDPELFLAALNASGDLQWSKSIDDAYPSVHFLSLALAQDGNMNLFAGLGDSPVLFRMNLSGDVQWAHAYSFGGIGFARPEVVSMSDGGMIIYGEVWVYADVLFPGFFISDYGTGILKVDSLGNAPCFDSTMSVSISELATTDSSFVLNYTTGAISTTVIPQPVPNTVIYRYDGCLFTGISSLTPNQTSVYPNPNQGRFRIESALPFAVGSSLMLYDITGKLLLQRPLPGHSTVVDIDLSRYGKGTFIIKLFGPDGVRHERVVVE